MNWRIQLITFFVFLSLSGIADAGIRLPWSTTYDCRDWKDYYAPLSCDGLARNGSWTVVPEKYYEQITAGANNPDGDGGKGQRHWIGRGTNNNSGGTRIYFATPQKKFWIRWYMRWQKGFKEYGQYKGLYFFGPGGSNGPLLNFFYPVGGMSFSYLNSGNIDCNRCGWGRDFYPGGASDGSWVYVEAMIDTAGGRIKLWIGKYRRLVINASDVRFEEPAISYIIIGDNQKDVANAQSMYVDYDDFAISDREYIGPFETYSSTSYLFLLLGSD